MCDAIETCRNLSAFLRNSVLTYSGQRVEIKCFSKLVVNFSQDAQDQSECCQNVVITEMSKFCNLMFIYDFSLYV